MTRSSEQYIAALDDLAGGNPRHLYKITDHDEIPPVYAVIYNDTPESGHTTGFTFGLSSANHADWVYSRPELMISVKSTDHSWAICAGEIVRNWRHDNSFLQGTVLHFRQRIVDTCPMTSFLIFTCDLLEPELQRIPLADRTVHLSQLYPIYEEEAPLLLEIGLEKFFFKLGIDFSDVDRPSAARKD